MCGAHLSRDDGDCGGVRGQTARLPHDLLQDNRSCASNCEGGRGLGRERREGREITHQLQAWRSIRGSPPPQQPLPHWCTLTPGPPKGRRGLAPRRRCSARRRGRSPTWPQCLPTISHCWTERGWAGVRKPVFPVPSTCFWPPAPGSGTCGCHNNSKQQGMSQTVEAIARNFGGDLTHASTPEVAGRDSCLATTPPSPTDSLVPLLLIVGIRALLPLWAAS